MTGSGPADGFATHRRHAETVRSAVTGETGVTEARLRAGALAGHADELGAPYGALVRQIRQAAHQVTDAQVAEVRAVAGSDKAAFEIVLSACIGAGLDRWDAAARAIEGALDEAG